MDIATAENRIVTLLSQTLQLTENADLFRFARPAGVYCGFTAEIVSGTPATMDSANEFCALVTGSDFDRTVLWNRFAALFETLRYGGNHEGFLWLRLKDGVEFSRENSNGLPLFTGKTFLQFSFL